MVGAALKGRDRSSIFVSAKFQEGLQWGLTATTDQIVDVKRAIAWVRATIAAHGGDPGFLAVTGGSAGGHLTALAALTPNLPDYQPGFEDSDTAVQAAVPFYGVYDFAGRPASANPGLERLLARSVFKTSLDDDRARWELASPVSHVGPEAPPFFVLHGTNDTVVPVEAARDFVGRLRPAAERYPGILSARACRVSSRSPRVTATIRRARPAHQS